ncbi:SprT family protein [Companilactobacillus halodurans]|uniref:SprT family protein n=1 Tax=Companilactobacillus halodurans TaxID=2584183 RepID=A0A5P0ZZP4_9LACO|nr:SprT family protein [Companilactobacillus halodurans]MQS75897.1 SprT family protein [Companilactobacillus halodurans]MQS98556.1 SprT family protein [Companilactobacillus halodurans]
MTDLELTELIKKVSQDDFGKPFIHYACFNNRLRTTGGRFHLNDRHIDINPKIYQDFGYETLVGVIKHELCHYHLYNDHLPAQHKDRTFKALLKQVGGLRYSPITSSVKNRKYHLYQCQNCHQTYFRVKKINTRRFVCGKCHGHLKYLKDIQKLP